MILFIVFLFAVLAAAGSYYYLFIELKKREELNSLVDDWDKEFSKVIWKDKFGPQDECGDHDDVPVVSKKLEILSKLEKTDAKKTRSGFKKTSKKKGVKGKKS